MYHMCHMCYMYHMYHIMCHMKKSLWPMSCGCRGKRCPPSYITCGAPDGMCEHLTGVIAGCEGSHGNGGARACMAKGPLVAAAHSSICCGSSPSLALGIVNDNIIMLSR